MCLKIVSAETNNSIPGLNFAIANTFYVIYDIMVLVLKSVQVNLSENSVAHWTIHSSQNIPCKVCWNFIKSYSRALVPLFYCNPNNLSSSYFDLNLFIAMGNTVLEPTRLGTTKTNMVLVYSDAYICNGNLRYYLHRIFKKRKWQSRIYFKISIKKLPYHWLHCLSLTPVLIINLFL